MIIVVLILLLISICINVLFGWYAFKMVKRFLAVEETFQIFDSQMGEFSEHLKSVYELEMFYGDTNLEALIQHTKFITEAYDDLKSEYSLLNGETDATSEDKEGQLEPKRFEFVSNKKRIRQSS